MKDKITQSDFEKAIEGAPHGYEVTIGGSACWKLHLQSLQQILEEAGEELPSDVIIKAREQKHGDYGMAQWMRSEASKVVGKLKGEIKLKDERITHWRKENSNLQQEIQQLKEELANVRRALMDSDDN